MNPTVIGFIFKYQMSPCSPFIATLFEFQGIYSKNEKLDLILLLIAHMLASLANKTTNLTLWLMTLV